MIVEVLASRGADPSGRHALAGFFGVMVAFMLLTFTARFVPEKSQRLRRPPPRVFMRHNNACLLVEFAFLVLFGVLAFA